MGTEKGGAWETYGGGADWTDPKANAMGAAKLAAANADIFRKAKRRDPNADEIYLMHQQGAGWYTGANIPTSHLMGNLPPILKGLGRVPTHEEFEAGWSKEVERRAALFTTGAKGGQSTAGGGDGFDPVKLAKATGKFGSELGKFKGLRADNPEDRKKIDAYMKEAGIKDPYNSETIAWCAAWLNSQLAHEGIKGSGGLGVDSFRQWGKAEKASQAQIGDVMIAKGGSHVGRFEGMDPKTGMAKFYAGNEFAPGETSKPSGLPGYPRAQWGRVNEREVDPNQFDFRGRSGDDVIKDAITKASPSHPQSRNIDTASMPSRPTSEGASHFGDLKTFQQQSQFNLHIRNETGATVTRSVAQLGMQDGGFQT